MTEQIPFSRKDPSSLLVWVTIGWFGESGSFWQQGNCIDSRLVVKRKLFVTECFFLSMVD